MEKENLSKLSKKDVFKLFVKAINVSVFVESQQELEALTELFDRDKMIANIAK